ncbi:uncharacterized protein LY79DRAFT_549093 [Colletotrichum navitas]|uniref:Uncharacterized protein n=1 Tax=Colletotrichum navitas TaxID=681940 RepID=A0AAD8V532_9PEZI|nr:uncharacterized protein LY79DRAFT_549093 [Colletotrichum navitas]KAK1594572.1 hypothetical protein LY79DRAFT_549093 [Colletotrichum navitas]
MEITIGMFLNRHEHSFLQPALCITCQAAPVVTGFLSAAGGVAMVTIDWGSKTALLGSLNPAASTYGVTYIIALGWTTSTAAGYTKRLTRNVMFMLGYSAGNLVSPQIWAPSSGPRQVGGDGEVVGVKVDIAVLDLTDLQNKQFLYPL